MFDQDLDLKIKEHEEKIEELRHLKEAQANRQKGYDLYHEQVRSLFDEYGISEYDIFDARAKAIVDWLKAHGKKTDTPAFFDELQAYFARQDGNKATRKKVKADKPAGPKLAIGIYVHPNTGERIEKKRRNPKTLDEWIEAFGIEEVAQWREASE
jgi:hypothetical protein